MPKVSFADVIQEWDALIKAVDDSPDLAGSAAQRAALAGKLARIRQLKATQDSARATKQECTRLLREEIAEGRMLAVQLRSVIRSVVDPRSERLVHFKMAPIRRRSRRAAPAGEPPADGAAPPAPSGPAGAPDEPAN